MAVSGKKLEPCDSEKNNILSLLHSSKEKLRRKVHDETMISAGKMFTRERIRNCCEQLRALLPHGEGRKADVASVLEATIDYMSYLQDRLPRDVTSQIAKVLQNNRRFSKGNRRLPKDSASLLLSPVPRYVFAHPMHSKLGALEDGMQTFSMTTPAIASLYSADHIDGGFDQAMDLNLCRNSLGFMDNEVDDETVFTFIAHFQHHSSRKEAHVSAMKPCSRTATSQSFACLR